MLLATILFVHAAAAQENWISVRAGQYEVYSNAGAKKALEAAADLQEMTAAVSHASDLDTNLSAASRVLIFRTRAEFADYAGPLFAADNVNKTGVALTSGQVNYILLDGSAARSTHILFHELAHQFINNTWRDLPLWYSEGLAEFYANFDIGRGEVELGRPVRPQLRVRLSKQKLIPMRDFFLADETSRWYTIKRDEEKWYAQAWAVVHKLMHERGDGLMKFLDALRTGEEVGVAFQSSFGITLQQFERELATYLQRPILPTKRVRTGPVMIEPAGEPRDVPPKEMRDILASLASVGAH